MNIAKKIKQIDITREQYVFFALAALVVGLLLSYAYFVNATVHSVVNREAIEQKMSSVYSEVSDLESRYLARIEDIDLSLARESGFQEVGEVHFATRRSAASEIAQVR